MAGKVLPPTVVFEAKSGDLQDTWLQDFDPVKHACSFASSPSGWTNNEIGFYWLSEVFEKTTKKTARNGRDIRLLIIDGHGSHIDSAFLDFCDTHQILVGVFPPHSTHRLQPLDVSLFSPLAIYYSQNLDNWIMKSQGLTRLQKSDFFMLFWPAFEKAFSVSNIESGWQKTGLHPFNPAIVLDQISTLPDEHIDRDRASSSCSSTYIPPAAMRQIPKLLKREAENQVLKHEMQGLKKTIKLQERKQKGRKALKMPDEHGGAVIYTPSKVKAIRDANIQKE
ncbi:DDE-domain-containing protein, partial [Viridothelium virens]